MTPFSESVSNLLLLAPRQLPRIFVTLFWNSTPGEPLPGDLVGFFLRPVAHVDRRQRDIFQIGQMGKEVEGLKYDANSPTNLLSVANVMGQFVSINDEWPIVMVLEPVEGADESGFA